MTIGPQTVTGEWTARLANLVHTLRPDWQEPGIKAALAKVADRPLIDVASAAIAACRRTDQHTPAIIAASGNHWPDPTNAQRTYIEPGIITRCQHGKPGIRCTECYPLRTHSGTGPTPEQKAAIRAAVAAGRAELARIEQINEETR
ncbi:MAG: hypothetical protein QM286_00725 [Acidobacteriota bacterium]|nr:hypothetical protein [Acidobacteriota bacterium]